MQFRLLSPQTDFAAIEALWLRLTSPGASSFFLSWGWMSTWLRQLPAGHGVRLGVWDAASAGCWAAFLGCARVTRHRVVRSRAYLLNETGDPRCDRLYLEYNALVGDGAQAPGLPQITSPLPDPWDELVLSGLDLQRCPGLDLAESVPGHRLNIVHRLPSPFVDLAAVAATSGDYAALLGSSTRSQLRRAQKLYHQRAPLTTRVADDLSSARDFYRELKAVLEATWRRRGGTSPFAEPWFDAFHQALIEARFASGEIQLLRVTCGPALVGLLYNFVHGGRVYYYQGGFQLDDDHRLKPGYVCHAEAIVHSARRGLRRYEFLAGPEEHKQRLATGSHEQVWARLQKPRLRFACENFARAVALRVRRRRPGVA